MSQQRSIQLLGGRAIATMELAKWAKTGMLQLRESFQFYSTLHCVVRFMDLSTICGFLGQKIVCGWIKAKSRVLWIFLLIADFIILVPLHITLNQTTIHNNGF